MAPQTAFGSRLTRLDTLMIITVGLLAMLAVSHIAIWMQLSELAGQLARFAGS